MADYTLNCPQLNVRNPLLHPVSPTANCITLLLHLHNQMSDYLSLPFLHHRRSLINQVAYCPTVPPPPPPHIHAQPLPLNPPLTEPDQPNNKLPPSPHTDAGQLPPLPIHPPPPGVCHSISLDTSTSSSSSSEDDVLLTGTITCKVFLLVLFW